MEIVYKVIDCEVKKLNDLTFEFTASTEDIDRDGEIIEAKGWDLKNYKKNPIVTWAHNYGELPVGKSPKIWVSAEGKLKNYVEFPSEGIYPFADIVRKLVDGGFLKAESVGFKPYPDSIVEVENGDGIKTPKRRLTKNELLEIAIVPVPSNPNALIEAKTKGIITDKELELITKPEETEDYIRIPIPKEEGKHDDHRIRTIDIDKDKGIKALYCGECEVIITYLFATDHDWTMESAQAWVREHGKEFHIRGNQDEDDDTITYDIVWKKEVSQATIMDEIDYLKQLIVQVGLNTASLKSLKELLERLPGNDIPVEIKETPKPLDVKEVAAIVTRTIARMRGKII